MKGRPEVVHIAITLRDDSLVVMQFITKQQRHDTDPGWSREPSKENIQTEIDKTASAFVAPVKSWRVVNVADLPKDRSNRHLWRDTGKAIRASSN